MPRRLGPLLLLALVGLGAGLVVARVPGDPEASVVTRRHHGADPLLSAVLLRFAASSLLTSPARYFSPPILYPDPNPLRGTEPLVAEALLALPFRAALGDRPALVYTCVKIATLALVAFASGLLLRELGVRLSLCLLAGGLSVLSATTTVFADRLQALSLQWLPLALVFALRFWRGGRAVHAAGFGACLFLHVQASLYTAVMLLGVAPFLVPLLRPLVAAAGARQRLPGLAAAAAAAAFLCLLVLWPYAADRADVAAYSTAGYAADKNWNAIALTDPLTSPPEYPPEGLRVAPAISWDGVYPGTAFLLFVACAAALALVDRGHAVATEPSPATKRWLVLLLGVLVLSTSVSITMGASAATRALATAALWGALATWCVRLLRWPVSGGDDGRLKLFASALFLAGFVLLLLGLGSPISLHYGSDPLLEGLFRPLSTLVSPLREMRELKRCLLPAGWAAIVATAIALELRLRQRPRVLGRLVAGALLAIGFGERLDADTRRASLPGVPGPYELLRQSHRGGGLLELPFDEWGRIASVHRMLWQPSHGRPIVAGKTGLDPAWYTPAFHVLGEFPSEESLWLLRAWDIGTVLDGRGGAEPVWPSGVELRGRAEGPRGEWRLLDLAPGGEGAERLAEPELGDGSWQAAVVVGGPAPPSATLASDGSLDTAIEAIEPAGLVVATPSGFLPLAIELDYGSGRFSRVPASLRVLGRDGGDWSELTDAATGRHLRARAAYQLMRLRSARLVIRLRPGPARELKLVADAGPWDLPELRLRLEPSGPGGVSAAR
jgi:hypothetical protein